MSEEIQLSELDLLKQRADAMGISYHPNIKVEKLKEKIEAHLNGVDEPVEAEKPKAKATVSEAEERHNAVKEATKLVRIRLTCMNPAKREWPGEIITVGNAVVGSHRKFIPFSAEDGYHVPNIIYEYLRDRQYQGFVTEKVNGLKRRVPKILKEFAIEVMPQLTEQELKDLAAMQAATKNLD